MSHEEYSRAMMETLDEDTVDQEGEGEAAAAAGPDKPKKKKPNKAVAAAKSIAGGAANIAKNPGQTAKSVGRGVVNAVDDLAETSISLGATFLKKTGLGKLLGGKEWEDTFDQLGSQGIAEAGTEFIDHGADWIFGKRSGQASQQFVEDAVQFTAGFVGAGRLKVAGKALKAFSPAAGGAARGALVDFAAFDPYKEQLAEMAARWDVPGLKGLGEMLSVDADDGALVSRFKRAAGGLIPGVAIDGMVAGARLLRNAEILKSPTATKAQKLAAEAEIHNNEGILQDIADGTHTTDEPVVVKQTPDGKYTIDVQQDKLEAPARPEPVLANTSTTEGGLHTFEFDLDGKPVVITGQADETGKFRAAFMAADGGPGAVGVGGIKKIGRIVNGMTGTKGFTFDHKGGRAQGERVIEGVEKVKKDLEGPTFDTRYEAEAQTASINETLAARRTPKVEVSNEQMQEIFGLAKKLEAVKDSPEAVVQLFKETRFNFNYMDAPEKVEALLKAMDENLSPIFDQAQGRPSVSFSESVDRALQLAGMITREDAADFLKNTSAVYKNTDAVLLWMNAQIINLGEQVSKWSAILDERPNDKVALAEARTALRAYVATSADVAGSNSGVARGLNALRVRGDEALKGMKHKGEAGAVESAAKGELEPDIIAGMTAVELRDVARLFRQSKQPKILWNTLAATVKPVQQGKVAAFGRGMLEFFYNSVLSAPATHAAIFLANGTVSAIEDGVRLLAGTIRRDPEMIREAADILSSRLIVGKQSLAGMVSAYKAGHSIIDPRPVYKAIPGVAGEVVRTMGTRPIAAVDEFWRVSNNLAYVRAQAMKLARRDAAAKGLKGKALDNFVAGRADAAVKASIDPKTGASRLPEAREFASFPTFSSPLRPDSFGADLEELVQKHPILTPILPFVRTSINVMDYSFAKSTPLGLFSESVRKTMAAGGPEAAIVGTRMAVGTTIWGTAGLLAFSGDITGAGPSDPKLKKMWLQSHQPYSIKVNGQWVSYRRAEPFATALSVTADLAAILRDNSDDLEVQEEAWKVGYGVLAATVSGITNKTYLSGLIKFAEAIGSGSPADLKSWADGLIQVGVPNVVQVAQTDPYLRQAQGMFDALKARVPGWSQSLPARYNVFGEPVTLAPSKQQRTLNPLPIKDATPTIEDEILELNRAFTPPPTIEKFEKISVNLHNRKYVNSKGGDLTPYERMMEIVNEQDLRGQIEKIVNSPAYQRAGDGTDVFAGGRRYRELQDRIDRVYTRARRKMLSEYPDLARELKGLDRAKRASARSDDKGEALLQRSR
jgi:hypothetical protein